MNKEVKEKWVEALRSGEYKQGRFALRNADEGYCCLGVLCDLYVQENKGQWLPDGNIAHCYTFQDEANNETQQVLPSEVVKWSDLPDDVGTLKEGILTTMNDGGKSFEEIANIIEKEL